MIDKKFWQDKKILVTGHTGFKGSWLACYLKYLGSEVYGVSDSKIISDNYKLLNKKEIFVEEFNLDISIDDKELNNLMQQNFDIVFHLAAQGIVSTAQKKPIETLNANIIGTYNVLNSVNQNNYTKGLIISTTDKVYAESEKYNTEDSKLGGKEFYSASKASAEHVIAAYINTSLSNNLNIGVVRSGNVLGGGDGASDRIVTDIINSLFENKNISIRNPESVRPWQYILDSLNGYLMASEYCIKNSKNEIFNIGSAENNEKNVIELTESIIQKWGNKTIEIEIINNSFYESNFLRIDSEKAESLLGWKSFFNFEMISEAIVDWYKNFQNNENITMSQIDKFHKMSS